MANDDTNYIGVLLEQIRDQNKAVLEAVGDIKAKVNQQPTRDEFNELKQDVKVIRAAVTDMSNQQKDDEARLTRLQATS